MLAAAAVYVRDLCSADENVDEFVATIPAVEIAVHIVQG